MFNKIDYGNYRQVRNNRNNRKEGLDNKHINLSIKNRYLKENDIDRACSTYYFKEKKNENLFLKNNINTESNLHQNDKWRNNSKNIPPSKYAYISTSESKDYFGKNNNNKNSTIPEYNKIKFFSTIESIRQNSLPKSKISNSNSKDSFHREMINLTLGRTFNDINLKNKKIINYNSILKNQNIALRWKIMNLQNKINALIQNNNSLGISREDFSSEKNMYLKRIVNLENELKKNNILLKQISEQKTNIIEKKNQEIRKLYNIIDEKDTEIINMRNLQKNSDIDKDFSISEKDKNNLSLSNDLLNQIFEYKNEIEMLTDENEKLKENKKLSLNNKSPIIFPENVEKELKKYKSLFFKVYHERENMKDTIKNLNSKLVEQKKISNKLKELNLKLSKENNNLKLSINNNPSTIENYENDNLKNNFTILENELKLKDNEINLLKNQNRQKTNKINKLELDITNFKSIIKDLKDKNNNIPLNKYDDIKQTIKLLEQKQINNSDLNNVIAKLNSQILQLENEQKNYILKLSKTNELEKNLKEIRQKNEMNFNQLKQKQNENVGLVNIIKTKDKEIENLQKVPLKANYDSNHFVQISNNNINIKNSEDYIEKNVKLKEENTQLKQKIELLKLEQEKGLIITLNNLKEELKDKNLQINNLIKENNSLRNSKNKNFENSDSQRNSKLNNEDEKIKLYKDQIKEMKVIQSSDKMQIQTLKEEIKDYKNQLKVVTTFNGQINNIQEFAELLNTIINDYKPKKQEQKDAFNKLNQIMNNMKI